MKTKLLYTPQARTTASHAAGPLCSRMLLTSTVMLYLIRITLLCIVQPKRALGFFCSCLKHSFPCFSENILFQFLFFIPSPSLSAFFNQFSFIFSLHLLKLVSFIFHNFMSFKCRWLPNLHLEAISLLWAPNSYFLLYIFHFLDLIFKFLF